MANKVVTGVNYKVFVNNVEIPMYVDHYKGLKEVLFKLGLKSCKEFDPGFQWIPSGTYTPIGEAVIQIG